MNGDHVEPVMERRVGAKIDTLKTDDMSRFADVVDDGTVIVPVRKARIPHQNLEVD